MSRPRLLVNAALAVAVVGAATFGYLSIGDPGTAAASAAQTSRVTRGALTATVTASGNVASARSVGVDLQGSGGVVTGVYVRAGDHVRKGQRLVKVDDTAARQGLATARVSLAAAQAQLTSATEGQTSQERARDEAATAAAQTSVDNAATAVQAAKDTYALDSRTLAEQETTAQNAVTDAKATFQSDQKELVDARAKLARDRAAGNADAVAADKLLISQLSTTVAADRTAVGSASSAALSARQNQASKLLQDRQSIDSQNGQLASAQRQLDEQRATAAVDAQPPSQGTIDSAEAQVNSAEVGVEEAEQTLADTVLRAPVAGTVASIAAVVGQSSSSTSSASTSSTSSASAASSTSGLVTLVNLSGLEVDTMVAEADVTKVKVGQSAQVALSASNVTIDGTVTAIDTNDTVTNNVVEYGVHVTLDASAATIRIGQTASVTVTTGRRTNVLSVPSAAITSIGGRETVTLRADGTDRQVVVQTGLVGETGTQITSGVSEGDVVVLPAANSGTGSGFTLPTGGGLGLGVRP
jgi:HlyD family secretion protein